MPRPTCSTSYSGVSDTYKSHFLPIWDIFQPSSPISLVRGILSCVLSYETVLHTVHIRHLTPTYLLRDVFCYCSKGRKKREKVLIKNFKSRPNSSRCSHLEAGWYPPCQLYGGAVRHRHVLGPHCGLETCGTQDCYSHRSLGNL